MKNTDDPIVAMIEAHRRACVETRATFEHQSVVENEFVAGVRWIAGNDAAGEALAVQDDLAVKLLETRPTTIAGAAALLTYYVDAVTTTQPEVAFPELDGRDFAYFIARNVAAALSNMAAAGDAIEQHRAGAQGQQVPRPTRHVDHSNPSNSSVAANAFT